MIYNKKEIEILREGGRRLAIILNKVKESIKVGVTTTELDEIAESAIRAGGDIPAFLGYTPYGADYPYPATLCVSVNEEIVHGIPKDRKLKNGDIVGIDLGLKHNGLFVDSAMTVIVGNVENKVKELVSTTEKALFAGIQVARDGARIGDIGAAIEAVVSGTGFGIVRDLGGHGVGHKVHEEPFVPNFGKAGTGLKLKSGMVLALEPMLNEGTKRVVLSHEDGYTFSTADGLRSAHFEHTILITDGEPEVLTKLRK